MPTSDRRRKVIEQVEELDLPEEDDYAAEHPDLFSEDEEDDDAADDAV